MKKENKFALFFIVLFLTLSQVTLLLDYRSDVPQSIPSELTSSQTLETIEETDNDRIAFFCLSEKSTKIIQKEFFEKNTELLPNPLCDKIYKPPKIS